MDNIEKELDVAIKFVEQAQASLAEDNVVVLTELQGNVAQICNIIAEMPIEKGKDYRDKMVVLSEKMEDLEIDLRAKKISVQREIKSANNSKTASTAYEKARIGGMDLADSTDEEIN